MQNIAKNIVADAIDLVKKLVDEGEFDVLIPVVAAERIAESLPDELKRELEMVGATPFQAGVLLAELVLSGGIMEAEFTDHGNMLLEVMRRMGVLGYMRHVG